MANEENTFAALLRDAPLYQKAETVTLTGSLARSSEKGRFALLQSDGSVLDLETDAVKSHIVIGNSFGQQIVQIELKAERMPERSTGQGPVPNPLFPPGGGPVPKPLWDVKRPPLDLKNLEDNVHQKILRDYPVYPSPSPSGSVVTKPNGYPYGYDHPQPGYGSIGPRDIPTPLDPETLHAHSLANYLPFLLATAHQAPVNALNPI